MTTLPAFTVPQSGYDLIDAYARDIGVSKSEAIRQLLAASPPLRAFAKERGTKVNLQVNTWGGQRRED